jgi:hypothetical protein
MKTPEPLCPSPDCLLVFVDDAGNESFRGQPYFGLGGIILHARANEALLKPAWQAVRKIVRGSEDQPLHACELGHARNLDHIETVAGFFRQHHFLRFGISTHSKARVPSTFTMRQPVYEMLKKFAAEAVAAMPCDSVALIFESSDRADPIVELEFGHFAPRRGEVELPTEFCFMPKMANEPALEVADFVANAVGGMARRMIAGRRDFGADFCSIFHGPRQDIVRYMHVDAVIPTGTDNFAVGHGVAV